jgi:hypothetical protein
MNMLWRDNNQLNDQGCHKEVMKKVCDELASAFDAGKIGQIVSNHEKLILEYYEDVQNQADKSFLTARSAAIFGFVVLVVTLIYALLFDALARFGIATNINETSMTVSRVGVVSGIVIEAIAGVAFWLYSRAAKQFGAFHICLERTHRYLLSYKIADEIKDRRDNTLRDLVCIMANAPMITLNGSVNVRLPRSYNEENKNSAGSDVVS